MKSSRSRDRRLFTRVAAARVPGADPALRRLSRSADHGRLLAGTAAGLALVGGRSPGAGRPAGGPARDRLADRQHRREVEHPAAPSAAGARALDPAPEASAAHHLLPLRPLRLGGGVRHRSRPGVGRIRRPGRTLRCRRRLLAGVRRARYPGDVLAGMAIGVAAAALTCRWWPPRPALPARERPSAPAPALPGGEGLSSSSSTPRPGRRRPAHRCRPSSGCAGCGPGPNWSSAARTTTSPRCWSGRWTGRSSGPGGGAVRSVCTGATAVSTRRPARRPGGGCSRGVPRRHPDFAQDVGVRDVDDRRRGRTGRGAGRGLGVARSTAGHEVRFLNTFSIGLYPELVRIREHLELAHGQVAGGGRRPRPGAAHRDARGTERQWASSPAVAALRGQRPLRTPGLRSRLPAPTGRRADRSAPDRRRTPARPHPGDRLRARRHARPVPGLLERRWFRGSSWRTSAAGRYSGVRR